MRTLKLYLSFLIALLPLLSLRAYQLPRLTVVVVVDGLEQSNIQRLRPYWAPGGLRTIAERGAEGTCRYNHLVYGGDETTVTLMTGALPAEHGYTMSEYFSRTDRRTHALLEDKHVKGIGSALSLSPRAVGTPMLTDLVRMRYGEHAQLYAIGIRPETTILLAGHAANGCCWIEADKRCWATTSFYPKGLPSAADEYNTSGRFQEIVSQDWRPTMPIDLYSAPTPQELKKGFSYAGGTSIKLSPRANQLVIDLALRMQESQRLGEDQVPDMLLLQLTTITPAATSDRIQTAEQEDMYLRLNEQLGLLLTTLQQRLGSSNVDFLLVGRPVYGIGESAMQQAGLQVQQFDCDRMAALTNTYLMALYGSERWVDGAYGQSLYLNRSLISQKRLSLQEIQRRAADFISEFEGVHAAFPQSELLYSDLRRSLSKRHQGDVVFEMERQWLIKEDSRRQLDHVVETDPKSPIFILSDHHQRLPETMQAEEFVGLFGL